MMKVLYCNPSFWDYRLPFYNRLNELFNGEFYVIYSPKRYCGRERLLDKIKAVLGKNALPYESLPFYNRLNELFNGEFYVIYSPKRYCGRERLLDKIKAVLGKNALPYENEPMFDVHTRSFNHFSEGHQQIPFPFGLLRRIRKVRPDVLITEGFFQWTPFVVLYGFLFRVPVFMGYERTLHTERNSGKIRKWHRQFTDWGFFQWTPFVVLYGFLFRVPVFMGYERTLHTERNSGKIRKWHRQFTDWFIKGYLVNGSETKKYLLSIGVKESKIHIGGMSADSEGLRSGKWFRN